MKRIGLLTSGGDCTAMNKVITTFVQMCEYNNLEPYLIFNGYQGLVNGEIKKTSWQEVRTWYDLTGTKIYSSRFPEFEKPNVQKQAVDQLKKHKIDALIVCGGNGSYIGAQRLAEQGVKVVGLPGTIDNDVASTDTTIGFHSSLEYVVSAIRCIRSTMESHHFITMVEIMGRECPDLTVFAGIATHADYVITKENIKTPEQLGQIVKDLRAKNPKNSILILVTEKIYGDNGLPTLEQTAKIAGKICNESIRINVLGYAQRGAQPSAWDLVNATRMTSTAIDLLKAGQSRIAIGNNGNEIVAIDLKDAVERATPKRNKFVKKFINMEKN